MSSLFAKPAKSSLSASTCPLPLTPTLLYHQLVWRNDIPGLTSLIQQQQKLLKSPPSSSSSSSPATPLYDINSQDRYGNTPLLLAVQLGHTAAASLLLSAGAATKYRNGSGWSPVQEALSRGDRDLIRLLVTTWADRSEAEFMSRVPHIMEKVEQIGDFYLEIDWKFSSWVPLLGRVLPSDRWRIWKVSHLVQHSQATLITPLYLCSSADLSPPPPFPAVAVVAASRRARGCAWTRVWWTLRSRV